MEYEELSEILNSLGSTAALKIFDEAAKGFKSGNEIVEKLGSTRRKYYRHLKRLVELGIIDHLGKYYSLTDKGKRFHKFFFKRDLNNEGELAIIDSFQGIGMKNQIFILDDYNNLINLMNNLIDNSTSEILIATKYLDLSVVQHLVQAINRDVKVKSVTDLSIDFPGFFRLLGIFVKNIRPNLIRFYRNDSNYKIGDVKSSFLIIDNNICIFELPSMEFQVAFILADKKSVKLLSSYFWDLWNRSKFMKIPDLQKEKLSKDQIYGEETYYKK